MPSPFNVDRLPRQSQSPRLLKPNQGSHLHWCSHCAKIPGNFCKALHVLMLIYVFQKHPTTVFKQRQCICTSWQDLYQQTRCMANVTKPVLLKVASTIMCSHLVHAFPSPNPHSAAILHKDTCCLANPAKRNKTLW